MGRFAGLANVRTNNSGIYFLEGNYTVELGTIKFLKGEEIQSGNDTFVVETTVRESDNPARGPGSRPSWAVGLKKAILETCLGDIKAFVAAVMEIENPDEHHAEVGADDHVEAAKLGCSPQDAADMRFWEESTEALYSSEQPAKGLLIKLNCTNRPKRDGSPFTKHIWGPVVNEAA